MLSASIGIPPSASKFIVGYGKSVKGGVQTPLRHTPASALQLTPSFAGVNEHSPVVVAQLPAARQLVGGVQVFATTEHAPVEG
jgi:hypothetical protein